MININPTSVNLTFFSVKTLCIVKEQEEISAYLCKMFIECILPIHFVAFHPFKY